MELSTVTGGPVVNESLETNVEGVFACGNVLHVHDLVDYVSGEAKEAGARAAQYLKGGKTDSPKENIVQIIPENGVRYTVPSTIRLSHMKNTQTVRFRVGREYRNVKGLASMQMTSCYVPCRKRQWLPVRWKISSLWIKTW